MKHKKQLTRSEADTVGDKPRKSPVRLTPEAWQTARRLYEKENEALSDIAMRMNVCVQTVVRRARRDAWVRSDSLREMVDTGDTRGLARMITRLANAFEHQIAAIEAQFRCSDPVVEGRERTDASTLERNARTLGSLAKTLDVLIELRAGVAELEPSGEDENALRRELADRLDRLCQQGKAAGLPVPPGPSAA